MSNARFLLYIAVIALAPTLPNPWMIALQAAIGGLILGMRIQQKLTSVYG